MTMRNLVLGALILALAASAEARLSEGEAAIVGGIFGYGLGQNRPAQQYAPPVERRVYVEPYPQQHYPPPYYRQVNPHNRYNFAPNQYPGVIRVYPDGTTVYSPE